MLETSLEKLALHAYMSRARTIGLRLGLPIVGTHLFNEISGNDLIVLGLAV